MARFGDNLNFGLKEVNLDKLPAPKLKLLDIDTHARDRRASRFMDQMDEMAKSSRQRAESESSAVLTLDEGLHVTVGTISPTFPAFETPLERRLREAKELIEERRFEVATTVLDELLEESAGHPEGVYLKAFCQFRLSQFEEALCTMTTAAAPQKRDLTRMRRLREQIRPEMYEGVTEQVSEAMREGNFDQAISRTKELIDLDPEAWLYHFLHCGGLMEAGHIERAYDAVSAADELGDPAEQAMMAALGDQIEELLCREKMAPARQFFKAGKFRKVLSLLDGLDDICQRQVLFQSFSAYARQRQKGRSETPPSVAFEDAQALYEYLVGEELQFALSALDSDDFEKAEALLERAVRHVPPFAWGNFLLADAIYLQIASNLQSESPPPIEQVIDQLELAAARAKTATADPENEAASSLLEAINEAASYFKTLKKEIEIVNSVVTESIDIHKSAEGGFSSEQQAIAIIARLEKLRKRILGLRRKMSNEGTREMLKQIREAVDSGLRELKRLRSKLREADRVKPLFRRFERRMKHIQREGVTNWAELSKLNTFFTRLKEDAIMTRAEVKDPELKKRIGELIEVLDTSLREMGGF